MTRTTIGRDAEVIFTPDSSEEEREDLIAALLRLASNMDHPALHALAFYDDNREVEIEEDQPPAPRSARASETTSEKLARIPTACGDVEVSVRSGLPAFDVVGFPDGRVREVRERVRAAVLNAGREFPLRQVIVTVPRRSQRRLAEGVDLAIAEGVLEATGQEPLTHTRPVAGELRLSGEVVGG